MVHTELGRLELQECKSCTIVSVALESFLADFVTEYPGGISCLVYKVDL